MEKIAGIIEEIIYKNDTNGYTVCTIRKSRKVITAVGVMPFINVGENIEIEGDWVSHPDYGDQIKVKSYNNSIPEEVDEIEKYLSSGVIKGIGKALAKKIVKKFNEETIKIIQFEHERLTEIKGINLKKAVEINIFFLKQEKVRAVIMFLQKYGITIKYALNAYKKFQDSTLEELKRNPYRLTDEDIGIPFKTVDAMAFALGIEAYSKNRITCGIKYVLLRAYTFGHTYLPEDLLKSETSKLLSLKDFDINDYLIIMQNEENIYIETIGDTKQIYLSSCYHSELFISDKLKEMSLRSAKEIDYDKFKMKLEESIDITLGEEQETAVLAALESQVAVITGGPGTGKTTIIKCLINLFEHEKFKVVLAAPTGRAAKRMASASEHEAKTIHRLLEMGYKGDEESAEFARNEHNPIKADVIILDEMSMVDIMLMKNLLKALKTECRLIMVGDVDQLPSVGPGKVLYDIIESGIIKTVKLHEIYRQAKESMIVLNAHKVNNGEYPEVNIKDKDFYYMSNNNPEQIAQTVADLCASRLPKKYNFNTYDDIQVIAPSRKGTTGIYNMNIILQNRLNPYQKNKPQIKVRDIVFREGDKIMQTKNNYSILWEKYNNDEVVEVGEGVFNGDIGKIIEIDSSSKMIKALFDDNKLVEYSGENFDEIELAYAITIHKSQGCEFKSVVIPLYSVPPMLINRNLIYTAITRAKELVVIVGRKDILMKMVDNIKENTRNTGLLEKLMDV